MIDSLFLRHFNILFKPVCRVHGHSIPPSLQRNILLLLDHRASFILHFDLEMQLRNIFSFLFLHAGLGAAFHNHAKRGAETNATLYAYGANSSFWPIAYGLDDGMSTWFVRQ